MQYTFQFRFINWQADAIHSIDPKSLVTVGAWSVRSMTDQLGWTNYYHDNCLYEAGRRSLVRFPFECEIICKAVLKQSHWTVIFVDLKSKKARNIIAWYGSKFFSVPLRKVRKVRNSFRFVDFKKFFLLKANHKK